MDIVLESTFVGRSKDQLNSVDLDFTVAFRQYVKLLVRSLERLSTPSSACRGTYVRMCVCVCVFVHTCTQVYVCVIRSLLYELLKAVKVVKKHVRKL